MKITKRRLTLTAIAGSLVIAAVALLVLEGSNRLGGTGAQKKASPTTFGAAQSLAAAGSAAGLSGDLAPSAPSSNDQAATSSGQGGATSGTELPDVLGRKIVQTTDIDVKVKEVPRAFQDIVSAATSVGGFVASSTFSNADDSQIADLTIRVPSDQYQAILGRIRGMGEVATEKSDASDQTQDYTDLQARLRTLQATEQRYLDLLAQAATVNDILTVQDRLDVVRGDIETTQGRIDLIDHLTDLATITVHLRPLPLVAQTSGGGGAHPINAAQSAWQHSLEALRGLAAAALVVAVFSWWLVPPLAVLAFAARWWMSRRPRAALPAA